MSTASSSANNSFSSRSSNIQPSSPISSHSVLHSPSSNSTPSPSSNNDSFSQSNNPSSQHLPISISPTEEQESTQVELFVKAGKDGESYGGCPVCQRFFMQLLIKAEFNKHLQLVVTTVNMSKPPAEFKRLATRLPALRHFDQVCSDPDEIVTYIKKSFRYPPMNYDNVAAANACKDVFSKFSFYVKDVSQSPQPLLTELSKLNTYLCTSSHVFFNRDLPDHLDCIMLPKLQHLRVASKTFKDFSIPTHFKALWRYLATAYNTPAFRESCPSDQEIIFHWASKPECPMLSKEKRALLVNNSVPYYSFDYPDGVLDEEPEKN